MQSSTRPMIPAWSNGQPMQTALCCSGLRFRLEAKALRWAVRPTRWIFLLIVLLCGGVESRLAIAAENEGSAKQVVEPRLLPLGRESAIFTEGAPPPVRDARPRGLGDSLSMHIGIDMPALDPETIRALRMQYGPNWLGPDRTLPRGALQPPLKAEAAGAELSGSWGLTPESEPIWRVRIRSAGAAAIAIRFEAFDVDGEVWVYADAGEAYAGPYSGRGPRGNGEFWSDPIPSDTVTVEYFPRQRGIGETEPPFSIPKISHHVGPVPRKSVESPLTPRRSDLPGSAERSTGSPYKDATCSLEWLRRGGHGQEDLVDSVALVYVQTAEGANWCSGVLLNGLEESDGTELPPYYAAVFTSGNCIENQRQAVEAKLYWRYRTSTCDGPAPPLHSLESTIGTRLWDQKLARSTFGKWEDYALLLVQKDELPSGLTFAGWTTRDVERGEDVYALGHPNYEPLRLAVGDVDDPNEGTQLLYSPSFGVSSDYGSIGDGYSGSPVFSRFGEDGGVVGILAGISESYIPGGQGPEWVVHKFGAIHDDFRHLRNVERQTQRVSYRIGGVTHWFTFFPSDSLGWVLDNTGVVESGDSVRRGGQEFRVLLENDRWEVVPEDDYGDTQGEAASISLGSSVRGSIGSADDVDWFRFDTNGPMMAAVYTTGATDTYGELDSSWSDDDAGEGTNFRIEAAVAAGAHFVRVSGFGSATGAYTLHVRQLSGGGGSAGPGVGETWTSPLGMEFVGVPAGSFVMGSPEDEEGRYSGEVQHEVRITQGFWMGRYEVTQGEWEAVMGVNPSRFSNCGWDCPVESVSWDDVQEFIGRLNERETASGYVYRLPTEAEWEYAARAGSAGATPEGNLRILGLNNAPVLDGQAWYGGNSGVSYPDAWGCGSWEERQYEAERCGTHPVGMKRANGWGLHDMLGNVAEWTVDWYGGYPTGSVTDPRGPGTGSDRVNRGGGFNTRPRGARSAYRYSASPDARHAGRGFRLIRTEQLSGGGSPGRADDHGNSAGTATEVALGLVGLGDWDEQRIADVRAEIVKKLAQLRRSIALDGADASASDTRFVNDQRQRLFDEIQAEIQKVFGPGRADDPATTDTDEEIYTGMLTRAATARTSDAKWTAHADYPVNASGVAQDAGVLGEIEDVLEAFADSEAFADALGSGGIFAGLGRGLGIRSGRIDAAGDEDWFRFETAGSVRVAVYTTGTTDTYGQLDSSWSDDDTGEGTNFRIEAAVAAGAHLVRVSGFGSATGAYTLHVRQLSGGGGSSGLGAGETWTNTLGMEFVSVPAGSLVMGSPAGEEGRDFDERQHEVRISRGFWIGRYEVTQGEWEAVMGANPSGFDECGARCPVERVSWFDVQDFIGRLNERETGRGYRYRLPTEAEWEYAARAGTTGARYGELEEIAWYWGNSGGRTHPVGEKRANAWGLHDVLGNVQEWTADWYGGYPLSLVTDPQGPGTGSYRVLRGGSCQYAARNVRSALRNFDSPGGRNITFGLRLVRTVGTEGSGPRGTGTGTGGGDDHGDSDSAATEVQIGSSVAGSIDTLRDSDWFRFRLDRSAIVEISLVGNGTGAVYVADIDGSAIIDDIGVVFGPPVNSPFRRSLAAGTYYVSVIDYDEVGEYTLHVRSVGSDTGGGSAGPGAGETWTNTLGMEFVGVPAGSFVMGSPQDEAGRWPRERQHEVRISQGFWMGKYEVTQGEWEAVMGANPSAGTECGLRCPVEWVSWFDVQDFIGRLNERETGRGYRYRLPTEAEWEYAARAGTTGPRYGELGEIAWYLDNGGMHPVGQKGANAWGLHDMLGNVLEWTADWYGEYPSGAVTDPRGSDMGLTRVVRGGGWWDIAWGLRSAFRGDRSPGDRYGNVGFRLVREVESAEGSGMGGTEPPGIEVVLGGSGESVTLRGTEGGGYTLDGKPVSSGAVVDSSTGARYRLVLGEDGTWTATLVPTGGGTGTGTRGGDDHGDSGSAATEVQLGSSTAGFVAFLDSDWFRFQLDRSATVEISLAGDANAPLQATVFDRPSDEGGLPLDFVYVNAPYRGSLAAGTYYVEVVSAASVAEEYTLHVRPGAGSGGSGTGGTATPNRRYGIRTHGSSGVTISGSYSYTTSGYGSRVTIRIDKVSNDSQGGHTGTLSAHLYATTASTPIASPGYWLASASFAEQFVNRGVLPGRKYFADVNLNTEFTLPPSGTYNVFLIITQYPEDTKALVSAGFNKQLVIP